MGSDQPNLTKRPDLRQNPSPKSSFAVQFRWRNRTPGFSDTRRDAPPAKAKGLISWLNRNLSRQSPAAKGFFHRFFSHLRWSDPSEPSVIDFASSRRFSTAIHSTSPDLPCTIYFDDMQWKALYCFRHKTRTPPDKPPSMHDVVRWIAKLGGYLGRKQDPPPGTQVLWKGIQRVDDIVETASVFTNFGADPPRPP